MRNSNYSCLEYFDQLFELGFIGLPLLHKLNYVGVTLSRTFPVVKFYDTTLFLSRMQNHRRSHLEVFHQIVIFKKLEKILKNIFFQTLDFLNLIINKIHFSDSSSIKKLTSVFEELCRNCMMSFFIFSKFSNNYF